MALVQYITGDSRMTVESFTPQALILTDTARRQARELQQDNKLVRVYVTGGGCSGFQYGFSIDEQQPDDTIVEDLVLIDSLSFQYLVGSTLDYKVDIMGSMFQLTNPNATGTCGCGVSFTV